MSVPSPYAHRCMCEVYTPVVDSDSDVVYDENCEGVLGHIEDFELTPEGITKVI